jgi:hypothetical protein
MGDSLRYSGHHVVLIRVRNLGVVTAKNGGLTSPTQGVKTSHYSQLIT